MVQGTPCTPEKLIFWNGQQPVHFFGMDNRGGVIGKRGNFIK